MAYQFDRIFSLDLETTGIDPHSYIGHDSNLKPRIWSAGLAYRKDDGVSGVEGIFNTTAEQKAAEDAVLDKINFYKNNQEYQNYKNGIASDSSKVFQHGESTPVQFLNETFKKEKGGMILVQNLNFERRHMAAQIDAGQFAATERLFEQPVDNNLTARLYTPSEVTEAKAAINSDMRIKEIDQAYDRVMQAYENVDKRIMEHNSKTNRVGDTKFYAADLMDFSRAAWAKAAAQGHIDEQYVKLGTNMEFLSQLVLGEKETHGALSDAVQQIKVFDKVNKIRNELVAGEVSEETLKIFETMQDVKGSVRERSAAKSLLSNLDKVRSGEGLDARERSGTGTTAIKDTLNKDAEKIVEFTKYDTLENSSDKVARLSKLINDNYAGTEAAKIFHERFESVAGDPDELIELMRNNDFYEEVKKLYEEKDNLVNKRISGEELTEKETKSLKADNRSADQAEKSRASKLGEKVDEFYNKARERNTVLSELLPENSKHGLWGIGLLAGAGLLYGLTDTFDDKTKVAKIKANQEKLELRQFNEPTFRQFEGLDYAAMPAGVGKANREGYNRSYEY